MLAQQEGQKHQHAAIMDDPPHIYVAFSEALSIWWVVGYVFGDQQSQTGLSGLSNHLCRKTDWELNKITKCLTQKSAMLVPLHCQTVK